MNYIYLQLIKKFKTSYFFLFTFCFILTNPINAQTSYLGLDGGFEGTAEVDNITNTSSPLTDKWSKTDENLNISTESLIVRSGNHSLNIEMSFTSLKRVWTPLVTSQLPITKKIYIQFYRKSASLTNTQTQAGGVLRGTNESSQSEYTTIDQIDSWEKVSYKPTSVEEVYTVAGIIKTKAIGIGGNVYIDDFCIYESNTIDNSAPDSPQNFANTAFTTSAELSWSAPATGTDGGGYLVVRGAVDPTTSPNVNGIYASGNSIGDGTVVYQGSETSFTDNTLNSSTTYYYRVYTYDKAYNYSAAMNTNFTTQSAETDYFKTNVSGNWNESSNWKSSFNNTDWVNATIYPTINSNTINIIANHEITISQPISLNKLTVNENAKLKISSDVTISALTLNPTAQLTLEAGSNYTGTVLNLESDENGTATLIDNGNTGSVTQTNVNQYLPTIRNWYISSPVASTSPSNMSKMYLYDETTNTWQETSSLNIGTGYIVVPATNIDNISFSGALNNGDIETQLTRSVTNTAKPGFNLIGNPYPSFIDWTKVYTENSALLSTATMWYRTHANGAYSFWTCNGESGIGSPVAASRYIPPMQAFWVRTITNGTFSFNNSMRTHSSESNLLKSPAQKVESQNIIRLEVTNGTQTDETVLYFNSNAKNELDLYDSPKISNNNINIPEIFTVANNERLTINGMKDLNYGTEIPLGFSTLSQGTFEIKNIEMSNFDPNLKLILIDKLSNTEQEINLNETYQFESAKISSTDRFSLIFKTSSVVTENASVNNQPNISINKIAKNIINITCTDKLNKNASITIFNSFGQEIINKSLSTINTEISIPNASGIYLIEYNNSNQHSTQKIIL